uniref:Uncharacterized protein n=1 Tax=Arundo donax TaxID=35708 RepID=A0A0A8YQ31_ARUDO
MSSLPPLLSLSMSSQPLAPYTSSQPSSPPLSRSPSLPLLRISSGSEPACDEPNPSDVSAAANRSGSMQKASLLWVLVWIGAVGFSGVGAAGTRRAFPMLVLRGPVRGWCRRLLWH